MVDLDATGREREKPEADVRKEIQYPWVYDCTFRDTLWGPDSGSGTFVDIARCEFEGKLKDGRWRHFFITGMIGKLDREMDVMKRISGTLEYAMRKGVIPEKNVVYEVTEIRPITVPEDKKKLLMKNRFTDMMDPNNRVFDEDTVRKIIGDGVGAMKGPVGGKF